MNSIYIVLSYTDTVPGKLIKARAKLKFWNRYPGDYYSHVSLCKNERLGTMMSFARKELNNPFNSGLVKEDIREGLFKLNANKSAIAVMKLEVTQEQYESISNIMHEYWIKREQYNFNYKGLMKMLFCGRGLHVENCFFCSEWVSTVLKKAGIDLFNGIPTYNIRPFDFYSALRNYIIYEGKISEYLKYHLGEREVIVNNYEKASFLECNSKKLINIMKEK